MSGDSLENAGERTSLDRMMVRDYFVVFAVSLRGYANVRTFLPGRLITKNAKRLDQTRSVNVAWQSH
jgi:hypothetical protein